MLPDYVQSLFIQLCQTFMVSMNVKLSMLQVGKPLLHYNEYSHILLLIGVDSPLDINFPLPPFHI
jgi:hypothetical protein